MTTEPHAVLVWLEQQEHQQRDLPKIPKTLAWFAQELNVLQPDPSALHQAARAHPFFVAPPFINHHP